MFKGSNRRAWRPGFQALANAAKARARASDAKFTLSDETAPIVADICRRLDGIALAIELAAARVRMLPPRQLAQKLDERFRVLTGGSRMALPRQQTMRALIDWSHDLLSEPEQRLFRRLAIFVGGWTLDAAEAVCTDDTLDALDVIDLLSSLVDKSLVVAEAENSRYRLLESTRAYALEKLDRAAEHDPLARRHLCYLRDRFIELTEQRERTAKSDALLATLRAELEDAWSALDGALVRSEVIDGAELLANTPRWDAIGEAMVRCEAYLAALPPDELRLRTRLTLILATANGNYGRKVRGFELAVQTVELARASGDDSLIAAALLHYAQAASVLHHFDDAEQALSQAEEVPVTSAPFRIKLLHTRALFSWHHGDLELAARAFEELRKLHRSLGDVFYEQGAALCVAEVEHERGRTHVAVEIVRETLPAARSGTEKPRRPLQTVPGVATSKCTSPSVVSWS